MGCPEGGGLPWTAVGRGPGSGTRWGPREIGSSDPEASEADDEIWIIKEKADDGIGDGFSEKRIVDERAEKLDDWIVDEERQS